MLRRFLRPLDIKEVIGGLTPGPLNKAIAVRTLDDALGIVRPVDEERR